MARIEWHTTGSRIYRAGVDRCVLFIGTNDGIAWSGITAIDTGTSGKEAKPYYADGVKYLNLVNAGEFEGSIKAYTYPEEFGACEGFVTTYGGIASAQQDSEQFSLVFRTLLGDDEQGLSLGYQIHFLYNLTAIPDTKSWVTLSDDVAPAEFAWSITGLPDDLSYFGIRNSCHLVVDSRTASPTYLQWIEDTIYGDVTQNATLVPAINLIYSAAAWQEPVPSGMTVTDNGDGTFTVTGPDANVVVLAGGTSYSLVNANTSTIDANSYFLSNST
jgi:hypothetical protein